MTVSSDLFDVIRNCLDGKTTAVVVAAFKAQDLVSLAVAANFDESLRSVRLEQLG